MIFHLFYLLVFNFLISPVCNASLVGEEIRLGTIACTDIDDKETCTANAKCSWQEEFWPPSCDDKDANRDRKLCWKYKIQGECDEHEKCIWQEEFWPVGCELKDQYRKQTEGESDISTTEPYSPDHDADKGDQDDDKKQSHRKPCDQIKDPKECERYACLVGPDGKCFSADLCATLKDTESCKKAGCAMKDGQCGTDDNSMNLSDLASKGALSNLAGESKVTGDERLQKLMEKIKQLQKQGESSKEKGNHSVHGNKSDSRESGKSKEHSDNSGDNGGDSTTSKGDGSSNQSGKNGESSKHSLGNEADLASSKGDGFSNDSDDNGGASASSKRDGSSSQSGKDGKSSDGDSPKSGNSSNKSENNGSDTSGKGSESSVDSADSGKNDDSKKPGMLGKPDCKECSNELKTLKAGLDWMHKNNFEFKNHGTDLKLLKLPKLEAELEALELGVKWKGLKDRMRTNLEANLMKQIKQDNLKREAINLKLAMRQFPHVQCDVHLPSLCWKTGYPMPSTGDWMYALSQLNEAFHVPNLSQQQLDHKAMLQKLNGLGPSVKDMLGIQAAPPILPKPPPLPPIGLNETCSGNNLMLLAMLKRALFDVKAVITKAEDHGDAHGVEKGNEAKAPLESALEQLSKKCGWPGDGGLLDQLMNKGNELLASGANADSNALNGAANTDNSAEEGNNQLLGQLMAKGKDLAGQVEGGADVNSVLHAAAAESHTQEAEHSQTLLRLYSVTPNNSSNFNYGKDGGAFGGDGDQEPVYNKILRFFLPETSTSAKVPVSNKASSKSEELKETTPKSLSSSEIESLPSLIKSQEKALGSVHQGGMPGKSGGDIWVGGAHVLASYLVSQLTDEEKKEWEKISDYHPDDSVELFVGAKKKSTLSLTKKIALVGLAFSIVFILNLFIQKRVGLHQHMTPLLDSPDYEQEV